MFDSLKSCHDDRCTRVLSFPAPVKLQTGEWDHQLFGSKRSWIVGCSINVFLFGLASCYYLLTKLSQLTYINPEEKTLQLCTLTLNVTLYFASPPYHQQARFGLSLHRIHLAAEQDWGYPLQMASSTDCGSQILQCSLNSLSIDVFFHHCSLSSVADWGAETNSAATWHVCSLFICTWFLAFDRCLPTSKTMLGRGGVSSIRHHFVHLISWVWHPSSFYLCCSLNHVIGTNMHSKKWKKKD